VTAIFSQKSIKTKKKWKFEKTREWPKVFWSQISVQNQWGFFFFQFSFIHSSISIVNQMINA
jgi:hypothetical protein